MAQFHGQTVEEADKGAWAEFKATVENEKVPTHDELKRIVLAASLRDRVCVILMAHSGVRPQVLGSYMGDSGLRLGDLPDLKIDHSTAEFEKTPALVRVPASLSKADFQYITFLSEEGCDYLREYLESRMRDGEKLTKESPVVTAKTAEVRSIMEGILTPYRYTIKFMHG